MKKVFIIHGFEGSPNGGWRPWLMAELEKQGVYACALSLPTPEHPVCSEWIHEISRHVERNREDEVYLIGHSLGVPAILRSLETKPKKLISGAILVSGPSKKTGHKEIDGFLEEFNFETIRNYCKKFVIIHGDDDPLVSLDNAEFLSRELNGELIIIPNGKHLNGSAGWFSFPKCLEAFNTMIQ